MWGLHAPFQLVKQGEIYQLNCIYEQRAFPSKRTEVDIEICRGMPQLLNGYVPRQFYVHGRCWKTRAVLSSGSWQHAAPAVRWSIPNIAPFTPLISFDLRL
jgi:hypothetical protein